MGQKRTSQFYPTSVEDTRVSNRADGCAGLEKRIVLRADANNVKPPWRTRADVVASGSHEHLECRQSRRPVTFCRSATR